MKKVYIIFLINLLFIVNASAQSSPIGIWQTIDDEDDKPKSHIEIFEKDGMLHGKILKLLEKSEYEVCEKCKGDKKDKPLIGMEIMWEMEQDKENEWKGGKIIDPKNGKEYKCKLKIKDPDVLEVRGFVGFSLLGRTQKWYRVKQ